MNQENAYLKGCEVKYLLRSKTSVDLIEFNSMRGNSPDPFNFLFKFYLQGWGIYFSGRVTFLVSTPF